eukprot:GHUV01047832.1.p2 GENE.GHUV01047832.1~~GHUV01047832.1.p2  ORF type:complete len:108 (-),score=29.70 GHUV01047832.1:707-1030(-)
MATVEESDELTKEQFKMLLEKVDSGLRALPATAQVWRCYCMLAAAVTVAELHVLHNRSKPLRYSRYSWIRCGSLLEAACRKAFQLCASILGVGPKCISRRGSSGSVY